MQSPRQKREWLGLVAVATLIVPILVSYFLLNNVAVYRSISLAPGTTITKDFWVNYNGFYRLGIVADKKLPFEELQCLLGINDSYGVNACNQARLKYTWALTCGSGRVRESGTSDKIFGGAYANDWMETEFGFFEAKRWERCELKMNFINSSPLLSGTNPKLRVFTELF